MPNFAAPLGAFLLKLSNNQIKTMTKVSVIGAGAVGATTADVIAFRELADEVVLLDVID